MEQNYGLEDQFIIMHHSTSDSKSDDFFLHCHNFYEIYYFISGDVHYLVEGQSFVPQPDSMLLIPPNVFHGVKIDTSHIYERYAMHFLAELLPLEQQEILLSPFHRRNFYFQNVSQFHLRHYCNAMLDCSLLNGQLREIAVRSRMAALLTQLHYMSSSSQAQQEEIEYNYSIQEIITYLNQHITEPVTLETIVNRFFISKNHLNRMFKRATGTTVSNYVTYKRITLAQQLLIEGQSASTAAINAGFQDYSTFYRSYKKVLGHSPADTKASIFSNRSILNNTR